MHKHFTDPKVFGSKYLEAVRSCNVGFCPFIQPIEDIQEINVDRIDDIRNNLFCLRSNFSLDIVSEYALAKKRGDKFPLPIAARVGRRWLYIIDGTYRVNADIQNCKSTIKARVVKLSSKEEALWYALGMHWQSYPQIRKACPDLYDKKAQPFTGTEVAYALRRYKKSNPEWAEMVLNKSDKFPNHDPLMIGMHVYGPCLVPRQGFPKNERKRELSRRIVSILSEERIQKRIRERKKKSKRKELTDDILPPEVLGLFESKINATSVEVQHVGVETKLHKIDALFRDIERIAIEGDKRKWESEDSKRILQCLGKNMRILANKTGMVVKRKRYDNKKSTAKRR